jgi:hypothetical protein
MRLERIASAVTVHHVKQRRPYHKVCKPSRICTDIPPTYLEIAGLWSTKTTNACTIQSSVDLQEN